MGIAAQCVHGAGLCVLPRAENDFRPLALRHGPLAFVSALLIAVKVLALVAIAVTPATAQLSTITTARIVQLTNAQRTAAGLSVLRVSSELTRAAEQKGAHMLKEDYFAHISPSGVTPWFWIKQAGYSYKIAGENLAIDFSEAEDVVAAWMASPSHKENMLHSAYTETGVAVVTGEFQGGTSTIVVHMFGVPSGTAVTPTTVKGDSSSVPVAAQSTPSPSPVPPATPTPVTPPPDTTPPRTPRIALAENKDVVGTAVTLTINGEVGSRVSVLVNGTPAAEVTLTGTTVASHTLTLAGVADGPVRLTALAYDTAGNASSPSESLALTKDTVAPAVTTTALAFIVTPLTDAATVLMVPATVEGTLTIRTAGEESRVVSDTPQVLPLDAGSITVQAQDTAGNASPAYELTLAPQFAQDKELTFTESPAFLSQAARRVALSFALMIAFLLILTIIVQIRVQRPALIAHATAVMGLAALLFFF